MQTLHLRDSLEIRTPIPLRYHYHNLLLPSEVLNRELTAGPMDFSTCKSVTGPQYLGSRHYSVFLTC